MPVSSSQRASRSWLSSLEWLGSLTSELACEQDLLTRQQVKDAALEELARQRAHDAAQLALERQLDLELKRTKVLHTAGEANCSVAAQLLSIWSGSICI